jgi:hypothetical protein
MTKIAFITALFGDKNKLDKPGIFKKIPEYDYFLFTNIDEPHFNTSWEVINIKNDNNIKDIKSCVRKSRFPKFMGWKLLDKEYDCIFYCDAYLSPEADINWHKYCDIIKKTEFGFIQSKHRYLKPGSINTETNLIVNVNKDSQQSITKTLDYFKEYDKNVNLDEPIYFENTTFGYDPSNPLVKQILLKFWEIYSKEDITYRDQPLWNFLLLHFKMTPIISNNINYNFSRNFRQSGKFVGHNMDTYKS